MSSSVGESHPHALPAPDMNLSAHPAPINQPKSNRLCLLQWLLPSLDDHQVRLIDTTPSLHPHYGTSPHAALITPSALVAHYFANRNYKVQFIVDMI